MPVNFVFFGALPDPDCETFADTATFSAWASAESHLAASSASTCFTASTASGSSCSMVSALPFKSREPSGMNAFMRWMTTAPTRNGSQNTMPR